MYDCVCANDVKNSPDGNCELPRQLFPFIWSHTGGSRLSLGQNINFSQIGSWEDRGHQSSGARAPRLWCLHLFGGVSCYCSILFTVNVLRCTQRQKMKIHIFEANFWDKIKKLFSAWKGTSSLMPRSQWSEKWTTRVLAPSHA